MIVHNVIQGSEQWDRLRHGVLTASHASELLTPGGEPKMPTYYERYAPPDEGPAARAKRQVAIWEWLGSGPQAVESSSALSELLRKGLIQECPPPEGAEPVCAPIKLSDQRPKLMAKLLHEWITGSSTEDVNGKWIQHGRELEPAAAEWFADVTGEDVKPVGFITKDDSGTVGCSPDLWKPDEFGVELKCPAGWTHLAWQECDSVPREHVMQVQFSLWVTGLPKWFFLSFAASPSGDNFLPTWQPGAYMAPILIEVEPEARYQDAFDEHVPTFVAEMLEKREALLEAGFKRAG